MTELSGLQKVYLQRILSSLNGMPVRFCIEEPDGTKHGNADLVKAKIEKVRGHTRVQSVLPYGIMTAYIRPHLEGMQTGEVRYIPVPDFQPAEWTPAKKVDHLQRSITALTSKLWGPKASMTSAEPDKGWVEVLKIGEGI